MAPWQAAARLPSCARACSPPRPNCTAEQARASPLSPNVRDAGALLQRAGFALPVTDVETVIVRYDSLFGLMRDLRAMGASNALVDRSRHPRSRRLFLRAAEIYAERFADADGRIRATFAFIWMSGWAPHASQQQPLKPGSAAVSLTEVLKQVLERDASSSSRRDGGDAAHMFCSELPEIRPQPTITSDSTNQDAVLDRGRPRRSVRKRLMVERIGKFR